VELTRIKGLTSNLGGQITSGRAIQATIPPLRFNTEWKGWKREQNHVRGLYRLGEVMQSQNKTLEETGNGELELEWKRRLGRSQVSWGTEVKQMKSSVSVTESKCPPLPYTALHGVSFPLCYIAVTHNMGILVVWS